MPQWTKCTSDEPGGRQKYEKFENSNSFVHSYREKAINKIDVKCEISMKSMRTLESRRAATGIETREMKKNRKKKR